MVTQRFHYFPFLPWELRDMIWQLAVNHNELPDTHFFALNLLITADINIDLAPLQLSTYLTQPVLKTIWNGGRHPTGSQTLNPSGYMNNSGLLHTCHESRQAFQNHYTHHRGGDILTANGGRNVAVAPGRDLFVLVPSDQSMNMAHNGSTDMNEQLWMNPSSILGIRNIAVHLTWLFERSLVWSPRVEWLQHIVTNFGRPDSIVYLIDSRIRLNRNALQEEDDRQIFRAWRRLYMEVRATDTFWEDIWGQRVTDPTEPISGLIYSMRVPVVLFACLF